MSISNNNNNNNMNDSVMTGGTKPCFNLQCMSNQWIIALIMGVLFLVISAPFMYSFTDMIFTGLGFSSYLDENGAPTMTAMLVHAGVYVLLAYVLVQVGLYFYPSGFESKNNN